MDKQTPTARPRIFISFAAKDRGFAQRLETELKAADFQIWLYFADIPIGENIVARIDAALKWCNTMLLIWSEAASKSKMVKLEWTSAIFLEKKIIPCILDDTQLPPLLAARTYVDFRNVDQGLIELISALKLVQKPVTYVSADTI